MKTRSKLFAIVVPGLVAVAAGLYWFLTIPATPVPNGAGSQARFTPGPWTVASEQITVVDPSRSTQAYNDFSGLPQRTLNGQIWRPVGMDQPGPLLVYSHGFMSFRQEGLYLIRFLASHGYTVIAVDYPLTGYYAPDGPLMTDVINQPGDISCLIDTILRRNDTPGDTLYRSIDPQHIAVAGVSLGGLTALLAGFHQQLRDPRVAAVVSIAGPTTLFGPRFFSGVEVPLLMIYSSDDAIVTYEDNALPVLDMYPAATLVTLSGASHAGFAQPASTLMRFIDNPDGIGCSTVTRFLDLDAMRQNETLLGLIEEGTDDVLIDKPIEFCTGELIPVAMRAARQHMFTTLAVHAFLHSEFGDGADAAQAHRYLVQELARENADEVSVTAPADSLDYSAGGK